MPSSVIFYIPNLTNETGLFVVSDDVLECVFIVVVLLWSLLTITYIIDIICTHLKA